MYLAVLASTQQLEFHYLKAMALLHLIDYYHHENDEPWKKAKASSSPMMTSYHPSSSMLKACLIELRHVQFLLHQIVNSSEFLVDENKESKNSCDGKDDEMKTAFFRLISSRLGQISVRESSFHCFHVGNAVLSVQRIKV